MGRYRTCTAKVVEIISEGINTMIYAPRIPTFLKLNAVRLNLLLVEQVIFIASAVLFILYKRSKGYL